VSCAALPADDVAFASEAFGWDVVPTAEELETDHLRQAEDDRRNEDDLLSRYPGLANLDDAMLREIVGNPLTGLMADADEAIEAANILLRRRGRRRREGQGEGGGQ
jgi:hypothetical protein